MKPVAVLVTVIFLAVSFSFGGWQGNLGHFSVGEAFLGHRAPGGTVLPGGMRSPHWPAIPRTGGEQEVRKYHQTDRSISTQHVYADGRRLLELIELRWNDTTNAWVNYWKDSRSYDAAGNYIEEINQVWYNAAWVNSYRYAYTYDANGNNTEWLEQVWNAGSGIWVNDLREDFTYDANGNNIAYLAQNWSGGVWVNAWRYTLTYNGNNNEIASLREEWSNGQWINSSREIFSYDIHGYETGLLQQTWSNGIWVDSWRTSYAYDANGREISILDENFVGGVWVYSSREIITYDASGKVSEFLFQSWASGAWTNETREAISYDAAGYANEILLQIWSNGAWMNDMKVLVGWQQSDVAYIYSVDPTAGSSYAALLQTHDITTDLIPLNEVASTDFSSYQLIIVDPGTSFGYHWGDSLSIFSVRRSGKPVLGLGYGGAGLFEEMGVSLNWSDGALQEDTNATDANSTSIVCMNPSMQMFQFPVPITIPGDSILQIYNRSSYIEEYIPSLGNTVTGIGSPPTDRMYYTVASEGTNYFWGFNNSPGSMTQTGKDLFYNIVSAAMHFVPVPRDRHPKLLSVKDVPDDQGGKVLLRWSASSLDTNVNALPCYSIWRAVAGMPRSGAKENFMPLIGSGNSGRRMTASGHTSFIWEWIATVPAHRFGWYAFTASTLNDAISTNDGKHYFLVSAQTSNPNIFFDSNVDSGYSVDNLHPAIPRNFNVAYQDGQVSMHWTPNTESDLRCYNIYRGSSPAAMVKIGTTRETTFVDEAPVSASAAYAVDAEDIHDNGSGLSPMLFTGISRETNAPKEFSLAQNYPNPFNPTTDVGYRISDVGFVTLKVFNMLGQEVATLVNEVKSPGEYHARWDASSIGSVMPSGVYYYRLSSGTSVQVKKMLLLR